MRLQQATTRWYALTAATRCRLCLCAPTDAILCEQVRAFDVMISELATAIKEMATLWMDKDSKSNSLLKNVEQACFSAVCKSLLSCVDSDARDDIGRREIYGLQSINEMG